MKNASTGTKRSAEFYVGTPEFIRGMFDAVQQKPWPDFIDMQAREAVRYERGRHLVAYVRGLRLPPRPAFVRKKVASWVADSLELAIKSKIIV